MNKHLDLAIMKRLFKELWLQSKDCSEPIEHIWFLLNEVAKSTVNSSKEIHRYLTFLVKNSYIENISSEPLLYAFTESGKCIKTDSDIEKIIKTII